MDVILKEAQIRINNRGNGGCKCASPTYVVCETYEAEGGALNLGCNVCGARYIATIHPTDGLTVEAAEPQESG